MNSKSSVKDTKKPKANDDLSPKTNEKKHHGEVLIKVKLVDDMDSKTPAQSLIVRLFTSSDRSEIGKKKTDENGRCEFLLKEEGVAKLRVKNNIFLVITDDKDRLILSSSEMLLNLNSRVWEANIGIPHDKLKLPDDKQLRPKIQVGPLLLDAEAVGKLEPKTLIDIARLVVNDKNVSRESRRPIAELSPELVPGGPPRGICGTDILFTIESLIALKQWPREIALQVDDVLSLRYLGFAAEIYECPNFRITYYTSGISRCRSRHLGSGRH